MTNAFVPLNIALLTITDTRDISNDISGNILASGITQSGHVLAERAIVTDDFHLIRGVLIKWLADSAIHVIISTGGTGLASRDVTPEVFESLYEKKIDGFGELFRWLSYSKIGTSTIQSRATAGLANATLMFALPGSPNACRDAWGDILQKQLDNRNRPCHFVEVLFPS